MDRISTQHLAYRLAWGGRRACKRGGGRRQVTVSALCTVHGELWGVPYRRRGGWGVFDKRWNTKKWQKILRCLLSRRSRPRLCPSCDSLWSCGQSRSSDCGWWSDCSEHEILDVIRNVHLLLPLLLLWRRIIRLCLLLLLPPKNKSFNSYEMDWTSKPFKFECKLIKTKFT